MVAVESECEAVVSVVGALMESVEMAWMAVVIVPRSAAHTNGSALPAQDRRLSSMPRKHTACTSGTVGHWERSRLSIFDTSCTKCNRIEWGGTTHCREKCRPSLD